MTTTARWRIGAALAASLLVSTSAAQAQTAVTVAVPNPSAILWLPLWVAIGEGYMEEAGLDITVEAVDGSSQVLQAMSARQAEFGAPGPGPLLGARARGVDIVYIYNLFPKSLFGLMVEADSSFNTPADLKGTVVGVGTADGAEVSFARAIFDDLGMAEGTDFEFLPVGDGGTATVAFMRDEVSSYAAAVSDAAIMTARGLELREVTPEEYLAFFGNGFATTREFLDENPEVVEGFGRALVLGMRFASDPANLDAALDHAAAGNAQEGEDRDFAAALLVSVVERMTPTDAYIDQGYGYQPPEHWELWHKSSLASGSLSEPLPDLEAAYTNQFIESWNAK